ncbi:MAG: energy-coupling factor ABC transporter permease [Muribaculaceae bacterium]|nr:energy-coupling factor ABC transporter permease [Muribaculaceae bacterium]
MHMADALVSTPIALGAGVVATGLLGLAGYKVNKEKESNLGIVSLMGVLGAFIFAAQMINFTIPGTGSSGHIIGGILLAAFLGPWAAFLTLTSVLIIQCMIFADGGLLALGCNILNMAAMSTLVAYPLIFRPIVGSRPNNVKIIVASLAASMIGLELGALGVVLETYLSGLTALPFRTFISLMTGIHLFIGIGEGLATAAILIFVVKSRPNILYKFHTDQSDALKNIKNVLIGFGIGALILGGGIAFLASEYPDGLEWSIEKITGSTELVTSSDAIAIAANRLRTSTSIMPDYDNNLSGILGALMVLIVVWSITYLITRRQRKNSSSKE